MTRKYFSILVILAVLVATFLATGVALAQDPVEGDTAGADAPADEGAVTETQAVTETETVTDTQTVTETVEPEPAPTEEVTDEPTEEPTPVPTEEVTEEPTPEPTEEVTVEPTIPVTPTETIEPTATLTPTVEVVTAGDIEAQANPVWTSDFAIMNTTGTDNQVSITYYAQDGSVVNSLGFGGGVNLPAFGSVRIPVSDIDATSFQGSALLQSSDKVAAAVRVVDSANGGAFDMYKGADVEAQGTTLYIPIIHRMKIAGWYGNVSVQNADAAQDANVTINYRTRGSTTVVYSETFTLKPFAAHYSDMLNPTYEILNTKTGIANWVGTVEIISNNSVPVVAREIQSNVNKNLRGVHEAALDTDAGQKFFIPLVQGRSKNKGGNGWTGFLLVMNLSGSPIDITAEFRKTDGTLSGSAQLNDLQPFDSYEFTPDEVPAIAVDPNWVGSAIVTSGGAGELFIAEQTNVNNKPPRNNYYLYKGNKDGSTATTLYFPYQQSTNLVNYNVVQNVGAGDTSITYRYFDLSGNQVGTDVTVNNVGAGTGFERATHIDEGFTNFQGSLMILSDTEPIEGYSTMCDLNKTTSGFDSCGTYTGTK